VKAQELHSQGVSKSRAKASFVICTKSSGSVRSYQRQTAKHCLLLLQCVGVRWGPKTTAEKRDFQMRPSLEDVLGMEAGVVTGVGWMGVKGNKTFKAEIYGKLK